MQLLNCMSSELCLKLFAQMFFQSCPIATYVICVCCDLRRCVFFNNCPIAYLVTCVWLYCVGLQLFSVQTECVWIIVLFGYIVWCVCCCLALCGVRCHCNHEERKKSHEDFLAWRRRSLWSGIARSMVLQFVQPTMEPKASRYDTVSLERIIARTIVKTISEGSRGANPTTPSWAIVTLSAWT